MKRTSVRILAMLLVCALVFALAGCTTKPISVNISGENNTPSSDNSTPSTDTDVPSSETESPSSDPSASFTRGTISSNVYTSDFIGISFHAPDGWYYYTDEEIAALVNSTTSYMKDPSLFEKATEGELIDFFCNSPDSGSNVDLAYTKAPGYVSLGDCVDATVIELGQQYDNMGLSYTMSDPVYRTLCGREYLMIECHVAGYMTQYLYLTKIDNYFVTFAGTFSDGTTAEQFEAMFS